MTAPLTLPPTHLGLYVHVPFCARKCLYCDFPSGPLRDPALADRYLTALAAEAAWRRGEVARPLGSIFLGGGTPTLLSGAQLLRLWQGAVAPFPRRDGCEVTIEANPGTLTDDVLAALAALPLTRVSLGVQSLQAEELRALGRIHTPEGAVAAVAALRALPVELNLDLMYGLPGQTPASWADTLDRALALGPAHLSLYALILEEGTPLAASVEAGTAVLPAEEEVEAMEALAADRLAAAGYIYYEVSNAARPGRHSRHNLGYWLGRDYLGLGPGAVSMLGATRWRNTADVVRYAEDAAMGRPVVEYIERLAAPARLLERVMLGLRLRAGFDLAEAEAACGVTLAAVAGPALGALQAEGLLAHEGPYLRLTPAGYPLANTVVARLMAGQS